MKNVDWKVEGTKLLISVDLSKTFGQSKSGKTLIIASTEGNQSLGEGRAFGLNVYKYPD